MSTPAAPGQRRVAVIGAGIGGMATAALLAKSGLDVTVYERQAAVGGRAGRFEAAGFTFDTGPSWFLMPEVFEHFFKLLDTDMHQLLDLTRLDPAYRVYFEPDSTGAGPGRPAPAAPPLEIHGDLARDRQSFEALEPGAGAALERYLQQAGRTYRTAVDSFLYTNFQRPASLLTADTLRALPAMARTALQPMDHFVGRYFKDARLKQVMEYPMVFLGTSPFTAPALYHLMSHMDFSQGVFYPQGGIYAVIEAVRRLAEQHSVRFVTNAEVTAITQQDGRVSGLSLADGTQVAADIVVSNADLHHTEMALVPAAYRSYPDSYWQKRQASPSALLMYLGVKGELPQLAHHTLLFTKDWQANFGAIFNTKTWPEPASMYICRPSATDPSVAPAGHENLFVLVPVQADAAVTQAEVEQQAEGYLDQLAGMLGIDDLRQRLVYKRVVGQPYFAHEFSAWQASGLGLSHVLGQSAIFRPGVVSKRLRGLYYTGANVRPGIGLPMCLISAELVYKHLAGNHSHGMLPGLRRL